MTDHEENKLSRDHDTASNDYQTQSRLPQSPLLESEWIIYANLTAYNAITPLIARGAAECKLMQ